ncbi:MAG: flagellar biosynthetic protein FliO [Elusimicrobia bacterium]|nr:flagellar biosynthetic protein FliO [Elusimicrobiota bacterium]
MKGGAWAAIGGWVSAVRAAEGDWLSTPPVPETPFPWFRLAALLLITVGFVVAAKRLGRSRARTGNRPEALALLGKLPLGPKSGVGFVAVGSRRFLVGFGENGVHPIARWEEPPDAAPIRSRTPALRVDVPNVFFHES